MRDITALHPTLQAKIKELQTLCELNGYKIGISECVRTKEEQDALYAQGRTTAGKIVTNAKYPNSMHCWGVAFDIYRNDGKGAYYNADHFFEKVGALGKSIGLEWGGDWKSIVDLPHFQLACFGSTPKGLISQYKTPAAFMATWNKQKKEEKKTYTGTFPVVTPALKKGSKGTQVNRLQNFLNWYGGYGLLCDSILGNASEKAIKDFQKKEGLTVDGIFGAKSLLKAKTIKR